MNNRKNKINALKQKIQNLRTQLSYLQYKEIQFSRSNSKSSKLSPQCRSKNREFKSPTFWNSNPITHTNKYETEKLVKKSPVFNRQIRQQSKRTLSPKMKNLTNIIDFNYYMKSTKDLHESVKIVPVQKKKEGTYRRYHQNSFDEERNSPKKPHKIKTFDKKMTSPILNPQPEKKTSIKIVKQIEPSPDKFLVQNPKSNTNLYCFRDKTNYLSKKVLMSCRNLSNVSIEHCPQESSKVKNIDNFMVDQKRKKSQKKHFAQYFHDIFVSHLN